MRRALAIVDWLMNCFATLLLITFTRRGVAFQMLLFCWVFRSRVLLAALSSVGRESPRLLTSVNRVFRKKIIYRVNTIISIGYAEIVNAARMACRNVASRGLEYKNAALYQ